VAQIRHGTGDDAQQPHNELPLEDKRRDECLLLCRGQNISEFLGFKDTLLAKPRLVHLTFEIVIIYVST